MMNTKNSQKKTTSSTEDTRIIKKYSNRRLYDTVKRSYITLNDIKQYVLDHIAFRVIDAQTKTDLTKATLFQVITEHESSANNIFTTELLQQMIRLYNENMQNVFSQMFEQFLNHFIQQKEMMNPFKSLNNLTQLQRKFWENWLAQGSANKDKNK